MSSAEATISAKSFASRLFRHAPAIFAATLFVSALLLFAVQPMFTKMVLPKLGGAPAIWSVAMVFFQAALLLGYAYAHWLTKLFAPRHSALIHLGVLGCAALSLVARLICGLHRIAVYRTCRERTALAALVCIERSSARIEPLRAVCRLEPRLVRGTPRVSRFA
jgi:hypothetical protein